MAFLQAEDTGNLEALQIKTQGVSPWNVLILCDTSEGRDEHRRTLVKLKPVALPSKNPDHGLGSTATPTVVTL